MAQFVDLVAAAITCNNVEISLSSTFSHNDYNYISKVKQLLNDMSAIRPHWLPLIMTW